MDGLPDLEKQFGLTGQTALVTGSSRGIGRALAEALAGAGARVILHGRDADTLKKTVAEFADAGASVGSCCFDVTDVEAAQQAVAELEQREPIDILVNNVGMQHRSPFLEFPAEEWSRLLDVNLTSVFTLSQAVARAMIKRGRGKIINIASIQAELARPSISAYSATKGGLQMFTRALCVELAPHNIQVNALAPGYFATDLTEALVNDEDFTAWLSQRTPAGRWGDVIELGGAAVFLASSASDFVNGHTLFVDGGMRASV